MDGVGHSRLFTVEPMTIAARYVHTNLIAHDWQRLARFYTDVFDCRPIGPQRDQKGEWLDTATGVTDAHLQGQHLLLPGHETSGPTLEIYTYQHTQEQAEPVANRAGYGHLAFEVDDVAAALDQVLAHGGRRLGTVVKTNVAAVGNLQIVYARDPEGNIIELQAWSR
jgi:catechol 2,3-dioxygenase-like lactoylglutathione lyase family enzyme